MVSYCFSSNICSRLVRRIGFITEGQRDTAQNMTDLTQQLDSVQSTADRAQGKIIIIVIMMLLIKSRILLPIYVRGARPTNV